MLLRFLKRYRSVLVVAGLLILPVLVYRAHTIRARDANALDRVVWLLSHPMRVGMSRAIGGISDLWRSYVDVKGARRQLGKARMELHQARVKVDRLSAVEAENQALRLLLEIAEQRPAAEPIAAEVIGAGFGAAVRTLDIGRGSIHGVTRGQAVVESDGLVGLIQRAGWTSSEVVELADPRLTVHARVARSRVLGRVRGTDAPQRLVMEDVSRDADVQPGDVVVTSGLGQLFPPNVPIGRVVSVEAADRGLRLIVRPAVDFGALDWVLVLPRPPNDDPVATPTLLRPPALWSQVPGGIAEERGR